MKKCVILLGFVIAVCFLCSCGCSHQWVEATCMTPKTCELCGATDGDVAVHAWLDATCTEPKTCAFCKIQEGDVVPHEWIAATCIEPKTCFVCKCTEGNALGHTYAEATCTTPETCSVCGYKNGDALGHILANSVVTTEATCTSAGIMEGTCTVCEKTLSEELPIVEHTPGEWQIAVEATYFANGTKTVSCTECDTVLEESAYELTNEEKEAWYKKSCKPLVYKEIARNPDDFKGEMIVITGEIFNCREEASSEDEYSIYFAVTKRMYGFYTDEPIFVFVKNYGLPRILEGDIITFYGTVDGLYDDFGSMYPKISVAYYEIK